MLKDLLKDMIDALSYMFVDGTSAQPVGANPKAF